MTSYTPPPNSTCRVKISKCVSSDKYEVEKKPVGSGAYGEVFRARERKSSRMVAIKRIREESQHQGLPSTALREISILKLITRTSHENIIKLLDVNMQTEQVKGNMCLVFEWMSCDLYTYIEQNAIPSRSQLKSFIHQIMVGTDFLHSKNILHRDLKPQNILLCIATMTLKIADFGLSRFVLSTSPERIMTQEVVTLWYRCPEIMLGKKQYRFELDIWSIGCIFAELVKQGKELFPGICEFDQLLRIFKTLGTVSEKSYPGVSKLTGFNKQCFPKWPVPEKTLLPFKEGTQELALLTRCLDYDPVKRITARDALHHAYFDDVHVAPEKCTVIDLVNDDDDL